MKRYISIIIALITIAIIFCGCGKTNYNSVESKIEVTMHSFEGYWERKGDDGFNYALWVQGNELALMFTVGDSTYSKAISTKFTIFEENNVFYLIQGGKKQGEIEFVGNNTVRIVGVGADFSGLYNSVETLVIE